MFQNIKVDIIYYKTNTDFEMEFNLCGCCRMRLLTDKSPDRKTLIHSLARAVSRSRVIIITGSLFGEEGIINLSAAAIGSSVSAIDARKYGISDAEEIEIITGSTPLVSPDGYFGGCIIESGPQTMILLSENKSLRKSVMQTLIHPYIEELCAYELKEKAAAAVAENPTAELTAADSDDSAAEEALPEAEQTENMTSTEEIDDGEAVAAEDDTNLPFPDALSVEDITATVAPAEPTDETLDLPEIDTETIMLDTESLEEEKEEMDEIIIDGQPEDTEEDDIILSGNMIFETEDELLTPDEEDEDYFIEPTPMKKGDSDKFNTAYGAFLDDENLVSEDRNEFEEEPRPVSFNIPILVITIIMLITLAVLCYCIFYVPSLEGVSATDYIRDIFDTLFV